MIMVSLREKLATTAVIYFLFLQLAIRFGIFGPTILDLGYHLNVSQSRMSIVFSVTSVGVCIGAISSGFLFKWIPKQIGLASLVVMLGVTVSFVTQIHSFYLFCALHFVIGITSGAAINGCEAWVLELWGEQCPPYMQALQFFRGLGYILGPILVEPFLAPELEESAMSTTVASTPSLADLVEVTEVTESIVNGTVNGTIVEEYKSTIYIPYMINGLMLVFGAVLTFFQYLYSVRKSRTSDMTTCSSQATIISVNTIEYYTEEKRPKQEICTRDETKANQSKLFTYSIIILCSVFYLFFFEEVVVTYLASFSTNIELHLTKSRGALLTSIFNLSNVIGKAISIVLALKLRHFTMLYMNLSVILVSLVILMIFSNTSLVMLWVGVCLLGVGLSSIIASLYALMENTITMDPMVCGILNMSGTLGSVFVPLAIANYIETYPLSMILASLFCAVSCVIIMIAIHVLIVYNTRRQNRKQLMTEKPVMKI